MLTKKYDHNEYSNWIEDLKSKISKVRIKTALQINAQLLTLYWELGKEISEKVESAGWGSKVMDQIAIDLKHAFPELKGFSRRNLYAIRQWYQFYSAKFEFVPQAVAQIPWGHNRLIISKVKNLDEADFYCHQCIHHGWSREQLEIQIDKSLYKRIGRSANNFGTTLPEEQSKIAKEVLKDPYNFDFLGLHDDAQEREIENELVMHITQFLLELGKGFAFVGRQFKIEISETDYFIDLLFYHLELRSYIVVELKAGKFKPEYAGKLNFYLSAVDSQVKKEYDNPTIGILLCKKKDKIEAEYALRDINKPMGISEYRLTEAIPENLKTQLPSIEELESDLIKKFKR